MLNNDEFETILQRISLKYLPIDSLLSDIEIKHNNNIKKYKNDKIFDAYNIIKDFEEKKENFIVKFNFKDDSVHQQSKNFAFDLLYM